MQTKTAFWYEMPNGRIKHGATYMTWPELQAWAKANHYEIFYCEEFPAQPCKPYQWGERKPADPIAASANRQFVRELCAERYPEIETYVSWEIECVINREEKS